MFATSTAYALLRGYSGRVPLRFPVDSATVHALVLLEPVKVVPVPKISPGPGIEPTGRGRTSMDSSFW